MRTDYKKRLSIPIIREEQIDFETKSGLLVANDYIRIVLGDRGPYIEFDESHIVRENIYIPKEEQWRTTSNTAYYNEWRTTSDNVKIYEQKRVVDYADYKIGLWYISPFDLYIKGEVIITKLRKSA